MKAVNDGFIPAHGGYKDLLSYRKAKIVYDATFAFCRRFLNPRDRTVDQMVQAARSGKQNIVEGSMASGTSKATEIKLMNVARASLEELLEDYRDYLRVHNYPLWEKDSREALYVRRLGADKNASYETFRTYIETRPPRCGCEHCHLFDPPGQLPAGPADPQAGARFSRRRRHPRTDDEGAHGEKEKETP